MERSSSTFLGNHPYPHDIETGEVNLYFASVTRWISTFTTFFKTGGENSPISESAQSFTHRRERGGNFPFDVFFVTKIWICQLQIFSLISCRFGLS